MIVHLLLVFVHHKFISSLHFLGVLASIILFLINDLYKKWVRLISNVSINIIISESSIILILIYLF